MKIENQKINWVPEPSPDREWILKKFAVYLSGKRYTVYAHGTCVVWTDSDELLPSEADLRVRSVSSGRPDFKVRRHADGNYLVTFRGGLAGLVSGEIIASSFESLREQAETLGRFPSEKFVIDRTDGDAVADLIAGLYARANLFQDARELNILHVEKS